ncbi:Response regulator of zinc sigma-54-dependent two-component system [hydrothermal vent metagenome]|uniref:Response regulator of zinc sigma-54-dependent two-component system n=1 Tax=hydrothermal vent metagenome TaxID=652676 RepID=A0A3B1CP36_9ZZZZ
MEITTPTILIVDDEERERKILSMELSDKYKVLLAQNGKEAVNLLNKNKVHLVLTDLKMPNMSGIELLEHIQKYHKSIPVIIVTAFGSVENAVEAMKLGALDYMLKPLKIDELEALIEKSLNFGRLLDENIRLKEQLKKYEGFNEIISINPKIKELLDTITHVAKTPATILIEGESGTGKQLFAQAVHYLSDRADQPFVEINCGAIPHDLLESELFGHEKGAFTGAIKMKKGKFELADGGTLFLDEIGELPMDLQVKLLHVVESQKFTRVGGITYLKTDVRIVAATNRNLIEEIQKNNFRQDLYYRLKVVYLHIPALSERTEDIPILVNHFLEKHKDLNAIKQLKVSDRAFDMLKSYRWPGNIRELENVVQQAMILARDGIIKPELLPSEIVDSYEINEEYIPLTKVDLQEYKKKQTENILENIEYKFLIGLLGSTSGNITKAAEKSGYDRRQIQNLLKKHNIDADKFR